MAVTAEVLEVEREGTENKEQMIYFIPSRDLPILSKRSNSSVSPRDIATSLQHIASSLGVAKGQSEHILVNVRHASGKVTNANTICEEIEEVADHFETQFTHRWLLNVNCLGWLKSNFDENEDLIDGILSESSRLVAVLSGQSASGGIRKMYHFPGSSSRSDDDDSVSVIIKEAAIVEDSLGGRTWSAAPLLADYLLKHFNNDSLNKLNILELGAGTGLTGLTLAKALQKYGKQANVHLTDFNENVLDNLKINTRLNILSDKAEDSSVHVKVFPLDWSDALSNSLLEDNKDLSNTYDCLLCADCIYESQHAELIHAVASRLLTKEFAITKPNNHSRRNLFGKMFVLTPLRVNLQNETEALYHFFPHADKRELDEAKLSLCITNQQDYILESQEDFGPPKLRTTTNPAKEAGPSSSLRAHLINASNNSHIDGIIYRLHTIEWCNMID
ncbi:hypothetical protein L7F22_043647 [Adiantum nelumboides]|nr:hypothetical protein [Adiantum nelumboides]